MKLFQVWVIQALFNFSAPSAKYPHSNSKAHHLNLILSVFRFGVISLYFLPPYIYVFWYGLQMLAWWLCDVMWLCIAWVRFGSIYSRSFVVMWSSEVMLFLPHTLVCMAWWSSSNNVGDAVQRIRVVEYCWW